MIIPPLPAALTEKNEVVRGPNIQPLPLKGRLENKLTGRILIKAPDHVTTDDILPGGAKVLAFRSNIPAIAEYVFERLDPSFIKRAKESRGGFIVAGENYGQGSSREHAAIAPMFLGIKAVIAKSFARIHLANLINFGILPLAFKEAGDYDRVEQGDEIEIEAGELRNEIPFLNKTKKLKGVFLLNLNEREKDLVRAGGALPFVRAKK